MGKQVVSAISGKSDRRDQPRQSHSHRPPKPPLDRLQSGQAAGWSLESVRIVTDLAKRKYAVPLVIVDISVKRKYA